METNLKQCVYYPWGELSCRAFTPRPPRSYEHFTTTTNSITGDGIHNISGLVDPNHVPSSPFVILFEERATEPVNRKERIQRMLPPYHGKYIVIPNGFHNDLGHEWNNRAQTMYVPRGTHVSLYNNYAGDDLIGYHNVARDDQPKVVHLGSGGKRLTSIHVQQSTQL